MMKSWSGFSIAIFITDRLNERNAACGDIKRKSNRERKTHIPSLHLSGQAFLRPVIENRGAARLVIQPTTVSKAIVCPALWCPHSLSPMKPWTPHFKVS